MTTCLALYNPLPSALAHYRMALEPLLAGTPGPRWDDLPGVEVGGTRITKAKLMATHVGALLRRDVDVPLLDLWPGFGHLETSLLASRRAASAVVLHDPEALRTARGYGPASVRLAASCSGRVVAVAHSRAAERRLGEMGYRRVRYVPHPIRQVSVRLDVDRVVRVLGQYKTARDLDLLVGLAPWLEREGLRCEIIGRGWPDVRGWHVDARFLDEWEFTDALASSAAVLVPYRHYWQSGVAVRALELGTPVVGPIAGFLGELFGAAWPGLVSSARLDDPRAWADAIVAVDKQDRTMGAAALAAYAAGGAAAWAEVFEQIGAAPA